MNNNLPQINIKLKGPRPGSWLTGPDVVIHAQYRAYVQHRNQSNFRSEPWILTFQQYQAVWGLKWPLRGRTSTSWCMTRIDTNKSWSLDNVMVITRAQHSARTALKRHADRNQKQQQWF
jgi:hypothetical protein